MLKYLLPSLRIFKKNKVHTAINVFGLGLGIAATLLAMVFTFDELAFDNFHLKADRIYRLNKTVTEVDGSISLTAETSGMMGPTLVEEFGEVEAALRYQPWFDETVLSFGEKNIFIDKQSMLFVDSTFFDVFTFPLLQGDKKTALARPQTVVFTEKTARALFGLENPIGKVIKGMNSVDFEVTGIVAEPPRNSHIQFDALMSWSTTVPEVGALNFAFMNNWKSQALCTYLLLRPGATAQQLQPKLGKFMLDHLPERADKYALYLQLFSDVYLRSGNIQALRMAKIGNIEFVSLFAIIAGFILFIACINYINISTSKATRRAKEVGMRKTLGATRRQLVYQFLTESFFITCAAGLFAITILYLALPFFNEVAGKTIPESVIWTPTILSAWAAIVVSVSILSGIYPSLVIAAFQPTDIFKASGKSMVSGNWARYTLVTFQFVISIGMIAGTLIVYQQIHFVLTRDLGFKKEQTMVVELTREMSSKADIFSDQVTHMPGVVSTSLARTALGKGISSTYVIPEGFAANEVEIRMFQVDHNFLNTYGLELAEGRFFSRDHASDSNALIVNEAFLRRVSWSDPLQKTIRFSEEYPAMPIIGVVKDFHFKSLYEEVEPLIMWIDPENRRNLSIRFSGNPSGLITSLEQIWKQFEERYPFQYYFVDEAFAMQYQSEEKLLHTIMTFTSISIIIACLGLYGLVSFTVEQRSREFGIRRVLGATPGSLNYLVNKKFMAMVFLGGLIASVPIYLLLENWLSKFAFKIEVDVWVFLVATFVTLVITILAVSAHALRVANMNPVNALRHE